MSRNKSTIVILNAASVDATSKVVHCNDAHALALHIAYKVTASEVDLISTVTIRGNIEDDGAYATWPVLSTDAAHVSVSGDDDDLTFTAGVLATLQGLPLGTYRGLIRIVNPPPFVVATYDFTSGGGTVTWQLKASY